MLGSDEPIMVQCSLGVWLVGVAGHELKKLLCDVQSPFGRKQCSHMSTKSTQSYVGNLTVGYQTSNVTQQSPHTGLYVQVVTIGHPTPDVTWQSQNSSLALNVTALPSAVPVSMSLAESPLAAVCAVDSPGTLSSTHGLDDFFAEMKTSDFNDGESEVMFNFEPASSLSCSTAPSRQEIGSETIEEEGASPTLQNVFAVTNGCKYDNEDKEIVFEYGDTLLLIPSTDSSGSWCSLSPSTSSCSFPGDSLVGFACGLLHAAGKLLQTHAMSSWMSSLLIDFPTSIQPQQLSLPLLRLCVPVCCTHVISILLLKAFMFLV